MSIIAPILRGSVVSPALSSNPSPNPLSVEPILVSQEQMEAERELKNSIVAAAEAQELKREKGQAQELSPEQRQSLHLTEAENLAIDRLGARSATKPKLFEDAPFAVVPQQPDPTPLIAFDLSGQNSAVNGRNTSSSPPPLSLDQDDGEEQSLYTPHSELLADDYTLHFSKIVGHGRKSVVLRCTHKATNNHFLAVKCIFKSRLTPSTADHLCEGIRSFRSLPSTHKSVLQLFAVYEDDDFLYLIHPLMCGGNMGDRLLRNAPGGYSERTVARMMSNLLQGLNHLHRNNVVHRAVRPENLFFAGENALSTDVVLGDLGFATMVHDTEDDDERSFSICGSMSFSSPEVLNHNGYSAATDIWAAGVVAYVLLTGKPPFTTPSSPLLQSEQLATRVSQPLHFPAGLTPVAQSFVKSLVHSDPKSRLTAFQALGHPWLRLHSGGKTRSTQQFPCPQQQPLQPRHIIPSPMKQ